ncbi:MAG: hypothetical protein AAF727_06180 [Pseudomonadota bacterium]
MPHPPIHRLTQRQMLELAARGLGRIDQQGHYGAIAMPVDEITAMAALLANFGLVPVPPGTPMPKTLIVSGEAHIGPAEGAVPARATQQAEPAA